MRYADALPNSALGTAAGQRGGVIPREERLQDGHARIHAAVHHDGLAFLTVSDLKYV